MSQDRRISAFYWILGILFTSLAFYRASVLSMTHDESSSVLGLINEPVWDYLFRNDVWQTANNHWLNTILFQIFSSIFGMKEWALRMGSVIAYPLFIYTIYKIYKILKTSIYAQFIGLGLLVTNAILFDFFSLARGYGLSISFLMLGLLFVLRYLKTESPRELTFFTFALLASSLSLFSNVIFFAVFSAALILVLWRSKNFHPGPVFTLVIGGIFLGLFTFVPLKTLSAADEFLWGADTLQDSFISFFSQFIHHQKYLSNPEIMLGVFGTLITICLLGFIVSFYKKRKEGVHRFDSFLALSFIFLIVIMILSNVILGSKFPIDRKCIIYFPFLALLLSLYADEFLSTSYKKWTGIFFGLFFMLHFFKSLTIHSVWEWWYDAHTKEIIYKIAKDAGDQRVRVGTHWMFHPTLSYYNHLKMGDAIDLGDYSKTLITDVPYDYFVLFKGDFEPFKEGYEIIFEGDNSQVLARRRK